jgi:cytochrome c biogenesis protein CcmG/thiol:disulfide interchange protein DsbE
VRRTALVSAVVIGVAMIGFTAVLATRRSALDQQSRSPLVGKPAPALVGSDVGGHSFDLTSLRGKYVLVNFFASWCVPCQHEQPQLVSFANDPAHDRTVVGVLIDDTAGPAAAFLTQNGGSWPAVADADGQRALDWGVRGPPESYLVNPDGIVLAKFIGEVTATRLDQLVAQAQGRSA